MQFDTNFTTNYNFQKYHRTELNTSFTQSSIYCRVMDYILLCRCSSQCVHVLYCINIWPRLVSVLFFFPDKPSQNLLYHLYKMLISISNANPFWHVLNWRDIILWCTKKLCYNVVITQEIDILETYHWTLTIASEVTVMERMMMMMMVCFLSF